MDIVAAQHDHFFRALMETPGAAGALLRERLPKPLVDKLGPEEPELIDGTFIDEELRESRSDRLYRLSLKTGEQAYAYCLLEHKSAQEPRIGWQLLRYMVRIWERLDRESGGSGKLPPIVPLVIYHGAEEWTAPRRFSGMVAASETMAPALLDFPFEVVDVGCVPDEELSHLRVLRLGLTLMKYAMAVRYGTPLERLAAVLERARELPPEEVPDGFWVQFFRYMIGTFDEIDIKLLIKAVKKAMPQKEKEMMSLAARQLMAEGRAEGKAEALVAVLKSRFKHLPEEHAQAISRADVQQLDEWLSRVGEAEDIDAVFGPQRH